MTEQPFLTDEEVQRLTGRVRRDAQYSILAREGIPATKDGDGKPIICRKVYEELHLGRKRKQAQNKPNLDAI